MLTLKLNDKELYKGIILPNQKILFKDNKKGSKFTLCFKCEDGVDFDIKINNDNKESFKYEYVIPRGMAGQTYIVTLKNDKGYTSNEVRLAIEKDIRIYTVKYKEKEENLNVYIDVYEDKFYISLDSMLELFDKTNKEFSFTRLGNNKIIINDVERRYFTYKHKNETFIYINDLKNIFDIKIEEKYDEKYDEKYNQEIDIEYEQECNNGIYLLISDNQEINLLEKDNEEYFSYIHGCLLGNIDTGEILFEKNSDYVCAIASTTKLLTLFLVREKIEEGIINYDTLVRIPEEAEYESLSEDGVVYLEKNKQVPLKELMIALMLPSSNESAIALACLISFSERNFAKLMNEKCKELGLVNSKFYNASGLPHYENYLHPRKLQNRMNAKEMFKLVSVMINKYPDLLEITSLKSCYLPTLDVTLTNTNPLLFNMEECVGLKTGTTNRAGCCLVSLCNFNGKRIVSIVFGAESSAERGEVSETLMKYAKNLYK